MLQKKNAEMTKKMEELEEVDLWFLTCRNIFYVLLDLFEDFVLCALLKPWFTFKCTYIDLSQQAQ